MNFQVDPELRQVIEQFVWNEQLTNENDDIHQLVETIALKIISASEIRSTLESMAGRKLSLIEVCYLVIQSKDEDKDLAICIKEASLDVKNILFRVFGILAKDYFVQVPADDLKGITLLMGTKEISALVALNYIPPVQPTQAENLEKLTTLRNNYDMNSVPDEQKPFLAEVDGVIQQKTEELNTLQHI